MSGWHGMRASTTAIVRRSSAWSFTGTSYLTSDGSAGAYAEAVNATAALVMRPGPTLATSSFIAWARDGALATTRVLTVAGNAPILYLRTTRVGASPPTAELFDVTDFDGINWVLVAVTLAIGATADCTVHVSNKTAVTAGGSPPGAYAAATGMRLFADYSDAQRLSGAIRSPAVFARALSVAEIAELHTLGPTHDLRVASGDFLGDVAHWWPADGDSGTTVTDRGLVGGCNLTLNGNVTIGAV